MWINAVTFFQHKFNSLWVLSCSWGKGSTNYCQHSLVPRPGDEATVNTAADTVKNGVLWGTMFSWLLKRSKVAFNNQESIVPQGTVQNLNSGLKINNGLKIWIISIARGQGSRVCYSAAKFWLSAVEYATKVYSLSIYWLEYEISIYICIYSCYEVVIV